MTGRTEFTPVAEAYILATFDVTEQDAREHAAAFRLLLEEKLGDTTHLGVSEIHNAIDVHLGLRLQWRDQARRAALMARLDAEREEARKRGLIR